MHSQASIKASRQAPTRLPSISTTNAMRTK
jgi:hypothetical protein